MHNLTWNFEANENFHDLFLEFMFDHCVSQDPRRKRKPPENIDSAKRRAPPGARFPSVFRSGRTNQAINRDLCHCPDLQPLLRRCDQSQVQTNISTTSRFFRLFHLFSSSFLHPSFQPIPTHAPKWTPIKYHDPGGKWRFPISFKTWKWWTPWRDVEWSPLAVLHLLQILYHPLPK